MFSPFLDEISLGDQKGQRAWIAFESQISCRNSQNVVQGVIFWEAFSSPGSVFPGDRTRRSQANFCISALPLRPLTALNNTPQPFSIIKVLINRIQGSKT